MAKRYLTPHILGLLLLCFLIIDAEAASPGSLSKPGCNESCGSVTIPFPFGMGSPDCFLNGWYEIECRNGTHPFLKKINLQVLKVIAPIGDDRSYYDSYINVHFPIIFSNPNCTVGTGVTSPPRLEGSPFTFSTYQNTFIVVGCNVKAMMNTSDNAFLGCLAECRGGRNFSKHSTCSSFDNCCKTTVPSGLQTLNVEFANTKNATATGINDPLCNNYAAIVNKSWFRHPSRDLESVKMKGYVPVALYWGIPINSTIAEAFSNRRASAGLYCEYTYSDYKGMPIYDDNLTRCECLSGYRGNPYLKDGNGCEDVDECEERQHCPDGWRCVNKLGNYHCMPPSRTLRFAMIGVGSSIGALLLVFTVWWLYKIIKKRKEAKLRQKYFKQNGGLLLQQHLSSPEGHVQAGKIFNQKELQMATENFSESRILGKGGQGTVYKGMLTDGRIVAIKKALGIDEGKVEQFINEVMILSQINHRNIVKLLGCCLETEIPLLVYEFIPNGTLYEYLHEANKDAEMSWDVRLQLATEIAGALFYLHSAASMPIFHRDIKSTNILLDEKYQAKIADFGTSRLVSLDQTHVTTLVQGTFGYLDPEYFQTNQFTDKSDVYSFGVVLVELLTGQKPISTLRSEEGRSLSAYFIISMEEGYLFDIIDSQFAKQGVEEEILIAANLAKRCLNITGRNRPTMKEVSIELEGIKKLQHLPNVEESEDNCMPAQYHNISKSASARLEINTNVSVTSDDDPLLFGPTW